MIEFSRVAIAAVAIAGTMAGVAKAGGYGAVLAYEEGISPRYFLGAPPALVERDVCATGYHSCSEIGQQDCCPDSQYCYIDSAWVPSCCDILSYCNNPCNITHYLCNITTTVSGTTSAASSCCQRPCSATVQYQCPSSLGASCCDLGFTCVSNGCISPPSSSITPDTSGCATGQFSCASSLGGGCCGLGDTCISSDAALLCSNPSATPIRNVTMPTTNGSSELSAGAKAAIGVSIGIVACLVIAGGLWFCMRSRRNLHGTQSPHSQPASENQNTSQAGPSDGRDGRVRPPGVSATRGYSGPHAVAGPYTRHSSHGNTPERGVPLVPVRPSDIMPPVEMGDSKEHSNVTSPGELNEVSTDYINANSENSKAMAELAADNT